MSTDKEKENKELLKEYGLSTFSINNKTSVYVLIFIIALVGLVSYRAMPKESFPEIKQPIIYVGTVYPGNSPVDMENLVTRPIEKEIKSIKGIKKFTSTSIQDYSTVIVEFDLDIKPEKALQDVKDAVDKIKSELPNDLPNEPDIFEMDFSDFPVVNVNISGNFSYDVLKENAEYLQDEFEKLPEISKADLRGLLDKEVRISVDKNQMEALKIGFGDIENAIRSENITMSGGDIMSIDMVEGDTLMNRRSIRIAGEFTNYKQMADIIVKDENQEIVYLRDIATIEFGPEEATSFARLDKNPVVSIDIKKKSGENLLNGIDKVKEILAKAQKEKLPQGMKIVLTNDQSIQTLDSVNNLENSVISGVILVVLILLFFMGVRNALFVGIAIPLSMLLGYIVFYFMGSTLNMMVLFGLIMALGMLVDNGIVVVENIYRLYTKEGFSKLDASKYGIGEVAWPIISSTLTTLAAFLPLLFWNDLIGEFMKYLPITIMIVLSASLFVALVVNPVLTANFMINEESEEGKGAPLKRFWSINIVLLVLGLLLILSGTTTFGNILMLWAILRILSRYFFKPASIRFQNNGLVKLENFYMRTATWCLKHTKTILFSTFGLLIFSFMFFGMREPKIVFFPDNEPIYFNVFVEMPIGTDIERTNKFTKMLEDKVDSTIKPYRNIVEAVLAQVGEGTSDPNEGIQPGASPNKARITVTFIKTEDRKKLGDTTKTSFVMEKVREALQGIPEANITVEKNHDGPPVGKPINVEVSGENYDTLIKYTNLMRAYMEGANVPGVDKLKTDLETGKPELIVKVNRDAARRFGISTFSIANTIRTGSFGKEISKYKEGEDDFPINLRLNQEQRYNETNLMNQKITYRNPSNGQIVQVPVSAVVEIEHGSTFGSVKRKDMDRVIAIYSNIKEGYSANEIIPKYKQMLEEFKLPAGYDYKITGEQEEQNKSSAFMGRAFMIAFLLIFLIIVAQFNSVINPLIIMLSVLFSTIGVFLGFGLFKMDFSILMCGLGIISLAGVAVNNAIVLIDFTNLSIQRRKNELGMGEHDNLPVPEMVHIIAHSGSTRLRPVLLTAITTVLGLVPLALGVNINFFTLLSDYDSQFYTGGDSTMFWGPLSWTIIFGLTFTTFLTLYVVPTMYIVSEKTQRWVAKLAKRM